MRAWQKVFLLSWKDRFLLMEAFCLLGIARLALLIVPFKRIALYLGHLMTQEEISLQMHPPEEDARQVGWAVEVMAHRTPWKSACLAQAIAGQVMLRRRGFSNLFYLGAKKDEAGNFTAHAWLQSGSEIILGGVGHETFTVLSVFFDDAGRGT